MGLTWKPTLKSGRRAISFRNFGLCYATVQLISRFATLTWLLMFFSNNWSFQEETRKKMQNCKMHLKKNENVAV